MLKILFKSIFWCKSYFIFLSPITFDAPRIFKIAFSFINLVQTIMFHDYSYLVEVTS